MPLSDEEFQTFQKLVDDEVRHTEVACTPFLDGATDLLLPKTPYRMIDLKREHRSYYGRSDYLVVADIKTGTGQIQRFVYFWELKSPQAPLMNKTVQLRGTSPLATL